MPLKRLTDLHAALSIKSSMEVRREEYLDYMTFRLNKRPLFTEIFGPMVGLREEWLAQGATEAELDLSAFQYRRPLEGYLPVNTSWIHGFEEKILEETDDHILARDHMGRTVKLCKGTATLPLPLDHPVRTMDDWLKIKAHYAFSEERLASRWEESARKHRREGRVVTVSIPGGFDEPRQLMGEEALCIAYYEAPELVHDILRTIGQTAFAVLDRVSSRVAIDQLYVHEDMAGKSGALIGPRQIEEFVRPYYLRIFEMLAERGARLFNQDSDGNMNAVIPAFLKAGINVMHPMEPAAGMDIIQLREKYGARLAFMGGIDKHVLRKSKADIAAELEYKIPVMVKTGGCLLGLDHRIINGTPLDHYRFYIRKAWEIMERETAKLN